MLFSYYMFHGLQEPLYPRKFYNMKQDIIDFVIHK